MSTPAALPAPGSPAAWLAAVRPLYLFTSVLPALLGCLVATGQDDVKWGLLPLVLVAMLLTHAMVNLTNDTEDFANGVDLPDGTVNSGVFTGGLLTVREGRRGEAVLFAGALVVGLVIVAIQGPVLLVLGLTGLVGGYLYTGSSFAYKYMGLGEPLIVLLMGPFITQGAYTALTGDGFYAPAAWLGCFCGFAICAVLEANNATDIDDDRGAGVRTIAVRFGAGTARAIYLGCLAAAYATLAAVVVAGLFGPWVLLPLLTLPIAARCVRGLLRDGPQPVMIEMTAQMHLLGTALLCVGVVLDRAF